MKEFDLAKAKAGAPVCTREGYPVRIICWDADITCGDHKYPIVAIIGDGNEVSSNTIESYDEGGACSALVKCPEDLMMSTTKHEGWVHVNDEMGIPFIIHGKIYKTKEQANAAPKAERFITVAKIEWEEYT